MLPKDKRLNLKKDFKWVASGSKLESGLVKLFYKSNPGNPTRVGIATSSKTFKSAVLRNRARRLTSSGFEKLYGNLKVGISIVVLPKERVLNKTSEEIVKDLEQLLKKAGILDETTDNCIN